MKSRRPEGNAAAGAASPSTPPLDRLFRLLLWAAAILIAVLALALQWDFFTHAGPLWRDEVDSLNLAAMPSSEMWAYTRYNLQPILWFLVLRGWLAIGLDSDSALRALGMIMGIGTIATLWFSSRRMGAAVPLLCTALFALLPETVRRGASLRAYGIGGILILLAMVFLWELVQKPSVRRFVLASVAAILSVQALYYNTVLLFIVCAGAVVVALRRRGWKRALLPMGAGALALLFFIPYVLKTREVADWSAILKSDLSWLDIWNTFREAMGPDLAWVAWAWVGAVAVGIAAAAACQVRRWCPSRTDAQRDAALYAGFVLLAGTAAYALLLKLLSYHPNPWHFYVGMAVTALAVEVAVASLCREGFPSLARAAVPLTIAACIFLPAWQDLKLRMSNMDVVAAILNKQARPGDLILLNPWTFGVTFTRYYHGSAQWMTVPQLADHRTHRYDEYLERLKQEDAIADVKMEMMRALQNGHRVWVLGDIRVPDPRSREAHMMPYLPPATDDPRTWKLPYFAVWSRQMGVIAGYYSKVEAVLPPPKDTHPFEVVPMIVFSGWRGPATQSHP